MTQRILVVEDQPDNRQILRDLLTSADFEVIEEDGEAGLTAAAAHRPDLILKEIQLPGLDGFDVAERLAAHADAPVVILISSREADAYGSRVDEAPVRGFLAKRSLSGAALAGLVS